MNELSKVENSTLAIITDLYEQTGIWYTKTNLHNANINKTMFLSDKLTLESLLLLLETLKIKKVLFCTNNYIGQIYGSNEKLTAIRGCLIEYKNLICMFTYSGNLVNKQYDLKSYQFMDIVKFGKIYIENYKPFNPELILNPSYEFIISYLNNILTFNLPVAFDLETLAKTKYPFMIGLSTNSNQAMVIQFLKQNKPVFTEIQEANILLLLQQIFKDSAIIKIAHNMCYDYGIMLDKYGFRLNNLFDTMIAWHTLEPEMKKSLGMVSSLVLNRPSWKHTAKNDMAVYNALDTLNTYALFEKLDERLTSEYKNTFKLQMKSVEPVIYMGLKGLLIDTKKQLNYQKHLTRLVSTIKTKLLDLTKNPKFNPASPKQVNELLYKQLNLPEQYNINTKGKEVLTSDEKALTKLLKTHNLEILKLLLKHRKYSKLLSTYFSIDVDSNNRVYTSYNITGTTTGRWSSSESLIKPYGSGNLQNIPPIARNIYIASPGKVIIQADYSQAEAVIVAYLTQDTDLINAFKRRKTDPHNPNNDIHKLAAQMIFGTDINKINYDQRQIAKKVRHAVNYQMGVKTLASQLDCQQSQAKKYWLAFYANNPNLAQWHKDTINIALSGKPLITPMGRMRYFKLGREYDIKKACVAFIPQSTVGDMLNQALNTMYWQYCLDILIQLHDAVYVECDNDTDTIKQTINAMRQSMQFNVIVNNQNVVLDVDFKIGKCWGKMEDYKQ